MDVERYHPAFKFKGEVFGQRCFPLDDQGEPLRFDEEHPGLERPQTIHVLEATEHVSLGAQGRLHGCQ